MERGTDGNYLVSRDEARTIKKAAALVPNMRLVEICAHYLAVRKTSLFRESRQQTVHISPDKEDELTDELKALPKLVERSSEAVDDVQYVYGPKLAELAVKTVEIALEGDYLAQSNAARSDDDVQSMTTVGRQLSADYHRLQ